MGSDSVVLHTTPGNESTSLIVGFSGWMDGGEVSTGTINYLRQMLETKKVATIENHGYYIYGVPGPMEITALFRPFTRIKEGLVEEYVEPRNEFHYAPHQRLLLFSGKEPHMNWDSFADAFFHACDLFHVDQVYFIGSVAGFTPHTREPIIRMNASTVALRDRLRVIGLRDANYEGPASIVTCLNVRAEERSMPLATMIAEIPPYIQGMNPRCIETMVKLLGRLLNLSLRVDDLHNAVTVFDRMIGELMDKQEGLAEKIHEMEKKYDDAAFDWELGDLKNLTGQSGFKSE